MHLQSLKIYQSRRFYTDEYEGQKELREDYFEFKREQDIKIAQIIGGPYEPSCPFTISIEKLMDCFEMISISLIPSEYLLETTIDDDTVTITYNPDWDKDISDKYFINRWLKRN